MAEILPFRALLYDPEVVGGVARVVTQPYDKITLAMQARYYQSSPYNLVRVILPRQEPGAEPGQSVYANAGQCLRAWIEQRALVAEREPAFYACDQEYELPGRAEAKKVRSGLIGLCRLEDYPAGVIHRHEETLAGPKADRLELLKATRAHFGQIFLLYSDPAGEVERMLKRWKPGPPARSVADEFAATHSLWQIKDAATIERIAEAMRDKKLVIADGHHRYETALAYRDLRRGQGQEDVRAEHVMVTMVRLESEGLTILPTHRVVSNLAAFDWKTFRSKAVQVFDWEDMRWAGDQAATSLLKRLERGRRDSPALLAVAGGGRAALLTLKKDCALERLLPDVAEGLRQLDVVLLHRLVLEGILGISARAIREEKNLSYVREAEEALRSVESGAAQAAFLLNPTPVRAVWSNALAGRPLPQKSTDFYPKLLSGMTIYWLDNPAGL